MAKIKSFKNDLPTKKIASHTPDLSDDQRSSFIARIKRST